MQYFRIRWLLSLWVFVAISGVAQTSEFDHTHSQWTAILKGAVKVSGPKSTVNYASLKKNPGALNAYLKSLSAVSKSQFNEWSKGDQVAFLINAYNAFTIKLILDHYPVKSIKKIGGFFSSPWKKDFFKLFGESFYLDRIEHEILRKNYKDARIHFAVNCASVGCPALRAEAYRGKDLDTQLNQQTQLFLSDTSRNRIKDDEKVIYASKIFDWFEEDFKPSVTVFLARHMKRDAAVLKTYKIKFLPYDWDLNGP